MSQVYRVKAPNGRSYSITGPPGATQEQALAQVLKVHPEAGQAPSAPAPAQAPPVARRQAPPAAPLLTPEGRVQSIQDRSQTYARQAMGAWSPPDTPAPKAVAPGNIDTHNRPVVKNPDGSISTVRSLTVGFGNRTFVLPTVVNGRVVSDEEAINHFQKTGEHLGAFESLADAEDFSRRLHEDQAVEYSDRNRRLVNAREIANLFSDPSGRLRPAPPKPVAPPAPAAPEPSKGFEIGNVIRGTGEATADVAGGLLRALGFLTETGVVPEIPDAGGFSWLLPEGANVSRGGGTFALADAVSGLDLGYAPGTTFEDVKRDPLGNVLPFIGEQGIVSLPAMALAAASTPALAASQTGSIAQQRAENDGRQEATLLDAAAAAPAAVSSALLERLGLDKIMKAGGGTAARRIFGAATGEALTEAPQSMIEYAGGTLGTEAGLDPTQMLEQGLAGSLVGFGVGGGIRGTIEAPGAAMNAAQRGADLMTALKAKMDPTFVPDPQRFMRDELTRLGVIITPDIEKRAMLDIGLQGRDRATLEGIAAQIAQERADAVKQRGLQRAQGAPPEPVAPPEAPVAPEPPQTAPAPAPEPQATIAPPPEQAVAPPAASAPAAPVVAPGPAAAPPPAATPVPGGGGTAPAGQGEPMGKVRILGPKTPPGVDPPTEPVYNRTDLILPNPRKNWQGVPIVNISVAQRAAGSWTTQVSYYGNDGGYGGPFNPKASFRTKEEAISAALDELAKAVSRDLEDRTENKIRAKVRAWIEDQRSKLVMPARPTPQVTGRVSPPAEPDPTPPAPPAGDGGAPAFQIKPRPGEAYSIGAETSARVPGDLTKVRMQFEIHDLSNLVAAEGELQNRDRSRPETQDFLREFVSKFDPEILGEDKFTDRGAPIINKDNVILSGNGRTMGLEEVYNQSPEGAAAYRKFLQDQGYDVEGIERPVLVRRVLDDVDERKFVTGSNANDKANLSAPEQARQDASDVMTDDVLALYTGGDLTKAGNDRFVSAFLAKLTARDRGSMMDDRGAMSTKGIDRINNALLHKAFGDQGDISRNFMSRAMERTDDDSKTLTKSLGAIAPDWVKFLRDMREGLVDPKYNIADKILEAVALVGDIKARGLKVKQYLEMDDMFTGEIDPFIRDILLAFHKNDLSGFKSMKAIGEVLRSYIKEASDQQAGEDMFGPADTPSPEAVWRAVDKVAQGDDEATLLDTGDFNDTDGTAQRDEGGDQGQPQEGRQARGQQQAGAREGRNRGARAGRGAQDRGDREGLGDQPPGRGVPTTGSVPSRGEIGGPPTIPNLTEALAALEEEEPAPAPAADVLEDAPAEDRSGITGDDKGGYADTFMEASFTNRRSVYETAINDLGMDPAKFTLLPTQRQKKLLADAFYKRFGIKIVFYGGLQDRKAIDQILDAYQTVQGMASVLGISERAMALGGKLELRLQKKGKFLGAYDPGPRMIMLPGRSNSFAHEWFHALDFYLMDELINGDPLGGGLTGSTRGGNQYQASPELREAWSNFLNAMFFDKAGMAQKILVLEAKIQATKSAAQKAAFQRQIDNLKRGTSSSKDIRSKFYKSAATVNPGDYWTKPTEMGARAFEAYVSMMAAQAELGTEFIGKGDFNYRANPEERFVKTFPKASERQAIFEAISAVMIALHNDQVIGGDGDPASLPPVTALRKVTDFDRMVSTEPNGSLIQREMDAWQRRMRRKAEEAAGRAAGQKSGLQRAMDVLALLAFSMAGKLKMLEARYQSPTIRKIHNMLANVPGTSERVGETFSEEVERQSFTNTNRLGNILKKHGLEDMTAADQRKLRDMLINEGDLNDPENQAMVRAAADIRILMDELFYDASNVGIDMGYVRHGYLPRTLDMPKVLNDGLAFVEKATRVYEIVWDNTFGSDPDEMVNTEKLTMFLRTAKRLGVDGVDEIRKLIKKANAIQSKDDPDAAMAAQMKAWDEIMEWIADIWDETRTRWATESANAWHDALITASGYDFDAHSPENSFTKKRELPPEADKIMEDFYVHNPIEAIHDYIAQSARRVAYVRRMGLDSKIRDSLIEGMSADGVSKEDQQEVLKVMDIAMGRQQSGMPRSAEIGLSALQFYGVIRLLPRAPLSSLVEPITAGITAGDFRLGFVALASAMAGSRTMAGKERAELARAMGIVTDQMGHIMADNRIGGMFADATRFDRMSQAMFERTGLVALTRAQRAHMLAVSHAYLDNLSKRALEGDERSIGLLKELGVRDPAAFAKELMAKNRMPTVDELTTKWGADYSLASRRFIDMTIQNPNAMHRPQLANNPVGRIVYGIMSFSMAFWRNVTKRQLLMIASEFKRGGVKAASVQAFVRLAPSAMALFVMQATISTLREYFLNPERWEELEKEGKLEETMLKLGLTRSFSMGMVDPLIQAYTGLRYQRDLSSMFVGPSGSVLLTDLAKIINLFARNSKKTNTGEYNAVEAGYNMAIGPAIATGLTMMPAGPILTPIAGAGIAYVTSPRMGDTVATAVVGEKGAKTPTEDEE